jgi:hypothetical protein
MNKKLLFLFLFVGIAFAGYLGGRLVASTDMFYIETPFWGKIQCMDFEHLNGTNTFCWNGYGASMVRIENKINQTLNVSVTIQ